ncbi:MAG TPA: glycosyltransferase family 4 protein [Terriglobales bacterium]|nr:glycosyltransferase family 4 protein [Terriglobales bacterium]
MSLPQGTTVAHVIARLNVGGAAVQVMSAVDGLRDLGYNTLLLVGELPPGETSMEYLAEERGLEITRVHGMSRKLSGWNDLRALLQLVRVFRRERPLIVHTHTAKAGALGRIASLIAGVPIRVHTFHGHVFEGYFSPLSTSVFVAIERVLARVTDCIVTVTETQRTELAQRYRLASADKIVAIPLGFDLSRFLEIEGRHEAFRNVLSVGSRQTLVGWIGRLTAIKAPGLFLEAAAALRQSPDIRFAMIGDGELRQSCEAQIAHSRLEEKLTITGWLKNIENIYSDLDMVVLTSINEGSPMALLEAMASGKAFIATDVGGVRDLMAGTALEREGLRIFENGILIDRDAGQLAKAIQFLVQNPELRAAMGIQGRRLASARYSMHRLIENLDGLYTRLASSKGQLTLAVPSA